MPRPPLTAVQHARLRALVALRDRLTRQLQQDPRSAATPSRRVIRARVRRQIAASRRR